MQLKGKTILIISPEEWGTNFLSKHNYAYALSLNDNMVWFIPPPINNDGKSKIINSNLKIIKYRSVLKGKNRMHQNISRYFHKKEINKILSITGKPDIVWSFDPYRFQWLKDFDSEITIYHTVDKHNNAKREAIIAKNADYIFSTSQNLFTHLKSINSNCYKISHGLSINLKKEIGHDKFKLPGNNTIKACYIGNFYKALDYNLIIEMIQQNKDVDFVFIGPKSKSNLGNVDSEATKLFETEKLTHVFFTGSLVSDKVNEYLKKVDICFVAFKNIELNSHKIMMYLYSGAVCLTTEILEYTNNDIVITKSNKNEFLNSFREIKVNLEYYNSPKEKRKRRDFALSHTYDKLIQHIEQIISKSID